MTAYTAQCACGTVRLEAEGEPAVQCYCHCRTCRSMTGAPVNAVALWPRASIRFASGEDRVRAHSFDGLSSRRLTCADCGGAVGADLPHVAMFDIFAGLVEGLDFRPTAHLNYENAVLRIADGLPKFRDMPERSGGTGVLVEE